MGKGLARKARVEGVSLRPMSIMKTSVADDRTVNDNDDNDNFECCCRVKILVSRNCTGAVELANQCMYYRCLIGRMK